MRQRRLLQTVVILGAVAASAPLHAQDVLSSIITNDKIGRSERARIEAEVPERVKKLEDAGRNPKDAKTRAAARDRIVRTTKTPNATKAGLDAYAEICAAELASRTTSEIFEIGMDAANVLIELDNANTAQALAAALKSKHTAVRYRAARGLELLHSKLQADQARCQAVLEALGRTGADEGDPVVLRRIYGAINFYADVPGFQFGEHVASALNAIFASRTRAISGGERGETVDQPAYAIAAACYPAATADGQRELAQHLAFFLSNNVERYFAKDTSPDYLPTLAALAKSAEDALHAMIRASKRDMPRNSVAQEIAAKSALERKEPAVRSALDALMTVLRGDPWNLS